nr:MAG TPA: hypothetical protein [Caudoviricetes sp.]
MSRERMVTRTVLTTECEVLCVDVTTVETTIQTFTLTGKHDNTEQILKSLKKEHETDTFKLVALQGDPVYKETMYGMKEIDFIKIAKKLDPDTRKLVE